MEKSSQPSIGVSPREKYASVKEQCRDDLPFFAQFFFPKICRLAWSGLHHYLFERRQNKTALSPPERRGQIDVVLAPRGAAKSTLISLVFPIHALLYRTDPYIVLISATKRQAATRLANLRSAIFSNSLLRGLFKKELGKVEQANSLSAVINESRIDAFSAGSELRGVTFGAWRPTWIILDDVEISSRVQLSRFRDRLSDWMVEVVENLGNGYTNIDLIGTLLHPDALPMRLARRSDVRFQTFKSILSESSNPRLWEQWRAGLLDLANPDGLAEARQFYESRASEMLAGASVLWPEKESYYDLQLMRAARGETAFRKEKQNEPPEEGSSIFSVSRLPRFSLRDGRVILDPPAAGSGLSPGALPPQVPLDQLRIFGFLDPAIGDPPIEGRSRSGDFAAIATVGIDSNGFLFVLDVWLDRAAPSAYLPKIFEFHERWKYADFGIETNSFQKILLDPLEQERSRRRRMGLPWMLPVREVRRRAAKTDRIAALEPLVCNHWIRWAHGLSREFLNQLSDFPHGRHDDGPDALEGAITLARSGAHRVDAAAAPRRRLVGRIGGY